MKKTLIAISTIGMMVSCVEDRTKDVIAKRIEGDTITTHKIRVYRDFKVGETVYALNGTREGTNKFKIVRECRR